MNNYPGRGNEAPVRNWFQEPQTKLEQTYWLPQDVVTYTPTSILGPASEQAPVTSTPLFDETKQAIRDQREPTPLFDEILQQYASDPEIKRMFQEVDDELRGSLSGFLPDIEITIDTPSEKVEEDTQILPAVNETVVPAGRPSASVTSELQMAMEQTRPTLPSIAGPWPSKIVAAALDGIRVYPIERQAPVVLKSYDYSTAQRATILERLAQPTPAPLGVKFYQTAQNQRLFQHRQGRQRQPFGKRLREFFHLNRNRQPQREDTPAQLGALSVYRVMGNL